MKSFGQTGGSQVDTTSYDVETNWMSLKEADGQTFVVISANKATTKWGEKYFLKVIVEGDDDAVEYTISASAQSAIFAQLDAAIESDGSETFPFRATVKSIGRTYELVDPPARKVPSRPGRPATRPQEEESPY